MQANIELLQALFQTEGFAKQVAKIQGEKIYRVEIGGLRHYRRESGRIYKSLTTFLDAVMPSNKFLNRWREQMAVELGGGDKAEEYVQKTADYGTALHIAVAEYCRNSGVEWSEFEQWAFTFLGDMGFQNSTLSYAHAELINDFAALLQFFHDYRVEVIAVELPVWTDAGVATLIDLIVEMDAKNYTEKTEIEKRQRMKAIINLKSGKKGFFENHVFQLDGERQMFNETYGGIFGNVDTVCNLAPNDWRETPTYKFKNQTEEANAISPQFSLLIELGKQRGVLSTPVKKFPVFMGKTAYGQSPVDAMKIYGYDEYSMFKIQSKQ